MKLLTLSESLELTPQRSNELFAKHINPSLMQIYGILGFSDVDVCRAEGVELLYRDGRTVLDFSSSFGILGLGHNHPRVIAAEQRCHEEKVLDAIKLGPHKLQAALAYNLAQWLPGDLSLSFFCTSGAEANEAAIKLCQKAQGSQKRKFITCSDAFHGKTVGMLPLTVSEHYTFELSRDNVLQVEYGNLNDLQKTLAVHANEVCAIIIEPIQGQGVTIPPEGYLQSLVEICRQCGVLVIFDEVKVGLGRTGTFFAHEQFEATGGSEQRVGGGAITPDVLTYSKALGGGKREIEVMSTSEALFKKAYGSRKACALHTTTFSGLGETCAVAIEVLNIIKEEQLVERARDRGRYLEQKLTALQAKHPGKIVEIRGRGLIYAIDFKLIPDAFSALLDMNKYETVKTLYGALMGCMVRELYKTYHILAYFSPSHPTAIQIMPPLVVEERHIDQFVAALDQMLLMGLPAVVAKFVKGNVIDLFK